MSQGVINPITHTEVKAWSDNRRMFIREEEVNMILGMDDAYIAASSKEHEAAVKRRQDSGGAPQVKMR